MSSPKQQKRTCDATDQGSPAKRRRLLRLDPDSDEYAPAEEMKALPVLGPDVAAAHLEVALYAFARSLGDHYEDIVPDELAGAISENLADVSLLDEEMQKFTERYGA